MNLDTAAKEFGEFWAALVDQRAEWACTALTTGKGARIPNPFEEKYFEIDPGTKRVAEKLIAAGLNNDREFVWYFERALRVALTSPIAQFVGGMADSQKRYEGEHCDREFRVTIGSEELPMKAVLQAFYEKLKASNSLL
jgi:hypothetical protein